jgi:hypothetical protein
VGPTRSRIFAFSHLRFDYLLAGDRAEAIRLERHFHEEYRCQYLDKPPLDGQSGQDLKE